MRIGRKLARPVRIRVQQIFGRMGYIRRNVYYSSDGNFLIGRLLAEGNDAAIGKIGHVEIKALKAFLSNNGAAKFWNTEIGNMLYRNAGVFPQKPDVYGDFCREFLKCLVEFDILAIWYNIGESTIVNKYAPEATLTELRALEPYYHHQAWSRYLVNKRVLVITPFEESIKLQYRVRESLWADENCLPEFDLSLIQAPFSDALVKSRFSNWFDALHSMQEAMRNKAFDVAIIGAGAYSIPLAAFAKRMGKFAIHIGGATQILFGIKGKRWDNHEIGKKYYNKYWIRPLELETPDNANIIEGGCYW